MQEAQRTALGRDLGVDLLCALVNNNSRCYDESLDFADHMEQTLPVGQGVRRTEGNPTLNTFSGCHLCPGCCLADVPKQHFFLWHSEQRREHWPSHVRL